MWHVDSNHRWGLVLRAGVDGFSRTVVYIVCANDNKATTALEGFLGGLQDLEFLNVYRLTTEVKMWRYMLEVHRENESCVLTGSSTHNERVEHV